MSIYERQYVRWYLKSNARNLCILCILLTLIPISGFITTSHYPSSIDSHIPFVSMLFLYAFFGMALAFFVPIYNFRYLMQKRSTDLFYAMPITKGRFFLIQFIIGAFCVLALPTIVYALSLWYISSTQDVFKIGFFMILVCTALSFSLYCMVTYVTVKCNNLWDSLLVNLGYLVAPLLLYAGFITLVQTTFYEQLISVDMGGGEIIPTDILLSLLSMPASFIFYCSGMSEGVYSALQEKGSAWSIFLEADGVHFFILWFWLLLGIVFIFLAYRVYKKRPQEDSEQRTTAVQCYPLLIILITLSLLFVCDISSAGLESVSVLDLCIVIVLYVTMVCFARRKIQVTKGMVFSFLGMIALAYGLSFVFIETNGFGRVKELPDLNAVQSVALNISCTSEECVLPRDAGWDLSAEYDEVPIDRLDTEGLNSSSTIQEVYDVQKIILDELHQNENKSKKSDFFISIGYRSDKTYINRAYYISEETYERLEPQIAAWVNAGYFDDSLMDSYLYYQYLLERK